MEIQNEQLKAPARDLIFYRVDYPLIHATKAIALGYFCDESDAPLVYVESSWTKPSKWTTTELGETKAYDAPQITTCLSGAMQTADLTYEFKDRDSSETSTLPWITYDSVAN